MIYTVNLGDLYGNKKCRNTQNQTPEGINAPLTKPGGHFTQWEGGLTHCSFFFKMSGNTFTPENNTKGHEWDFPSGSHPDKDHHHQQKKALTDLQDHFPGLNDDDQGAIREKER